MNKKYAEMPGNALASQALFEREVKKIGVGVLEIEHHITRLREEGLQIGALRCIGPSEDRADWLIIVKATTENKAVISFHGADTLGTALTGLANRLKNGSLKWKEDEYA